MKRLITLACLCWMTSTVKGQLPERNVAIVPVNAIMLFASSYQGALMVDLGEKRDWIELGFIAGLANDYYSVGGESGFFARYRINLNRDANVAFRGNTYIAPYVHFVSNQSLDQPSFECCNYKRTAVGIAFAGSFDISEGFFLDFFLGLDSGRQRNEDPSNQYGSYNQIRGVIGIQPGFRL